jgi:hypothetical protein
MLCKVFTIHNVFFGRDVLGMQDSVSAAPLIVFSWPVIVRSLLFHRGPACFVPASYSVFRCFSIGYPLYCLLNLLAFNAFPTDTMLSCIRTMHPSSSLLYRIPQLLRL